jgi:hypothetical protein
VVSKPKPSSHLLRRLVLCLRLSRNSKDGLEEAKTQNCGLAACSCRSSGREVRFLGVKYGVRRDEEKGT